MRTMHARRGARCTVEKGLGLSGCVLIVIAVVLLGWASGASGKGSRHNGDFEDFPLWYEIPVKAFAVLHEGDLYGTRWATYVYRPRGSMAKGRETPCVLIARISWDGSYNSANGCGQPVPVSGVDVPPVFPMLGGTIVNRAGDIQGEAFGAIAVTGDVVKISVAVEPGPAIVRRTIPVGKRRAHKARVAPFRYAAFGVGRDACAKAVSGFDKAGKLVLQEPLEGCLPS